MATAASLSPGAHPAAPLLGQGFDPIGEKGILGGGIGEDKDVGERRRMQQGQLAGRKGPALTVRSSGHGYCREDRGQGVRARPRPDSGEQAWRRGGAVRLWLPLVVGPGQVRTSGKTGEGQTSRADRHISGSSPPPKAWISFSRCQKV